MKKALLTMCCVLVSVSIASGTPFINPPENDSQIPPGGWVSSFPYQRNALIDFATDPANWPKDMVRGKDLIPNLNYDLEGEDDGELYESDFFDWEESLDWIDTDNRFPGRQGLIGIDRREGAALWLTWHLDNHPDPRQWKHLWIEMEYYIDDSSGWLGNVVPEPPASWIDVTQTWEDLGNGWWRTNIWALIEPNPAWEELQWELWTAGTPGISEVSPTVLIDSWHVATECVPEPATIALLLLGGLGILRPRR